MYDAWTSRRNSSAVDACVVSILGMVAVCIFPSRECGSKSKLGESNFVVSIALYAKTTITQRMEMYESCAQHSNFRFTSNLE